MRKTDTRFEPGKRRNHQRVYRDGDVWFYHTREGRRGPFLSETELRADLQSYIGTMEFIEDNAALIPGEIDHQDVTVVDLDTPRFG